MNMRNFFNPHKNVDSGVQYLRYVDPDERKFMPSPAAMVIQACSATSTWAQKMGGMDNFLQQSWNR
jgi:hypothetical protein